jgi:hypothetical protein
VYVTHTFAGVVDKTNGAIAALHARQGGRCLRAVVLYASGIWLQL